MPFVLGKAGKSFEKTRLKPHPFASITWIRFDGSVTLPRNTLSLRAKKQRRLAPL